MYAPSTQFLSHTSLNYNVLWHALLFCLCVVGNFTYTLDLLSLELFVCTFSTNPSLSIMLTFKQLIPLFSFGCVKTYFYLTCTSLFGLLASFIADIIVIVYRQRTPQTSHGHHQHSTLQRFINSIAACR